MEDSFDLERLSRELAGTPFCGQVHYFAAIGSTSTHAMREAEAGAPHGSVYLADEQTAGRGRAAHAWHSPAGSGLYVSVLLRPALAPADALWLSLAAGLAALAAIARSTGLAADLRWPNDLLLGGRKFAGILTEMNAEATRVRHAVIGIGINVHQQSLPADLAPVATSLRIESGRSFPRQRLLAELLKALDQETSPLGTPEGLFAARGEIPRRLEAASSWIRGRRVAVGDPPQFEGTTAGLDERGFLLVDTAQGRRTVLSGGVRALLP